MKGNCASFGKKSLSGRWVSNVSKIATKNAKSIQLKNHIHPHNLPMTGIPNSSAEQHDDSGKLIRIRYYDINGNAYKDIDYIDHGRPDTHKVPHTHIIEINNEIDRKKGASSYANQ